MLRLIALQPIKRCMNVGIVYPVGTAASSQTSMRDLFYQEVASNSKDSETPLGNLCVTPTSGRFVGPGLATLLTLSR